MKMEQKAVKLEYKMINFVFFSAAESAYMTNVMKGVT